MTTCGKHATSYRLQAAAKWGRKGQALLELAIFGTVAIAAIGFLIRVGMKVNFDQEIRMAAFRRALAAAHQDNGTDQDALGTVYHMISHRQMPNPNDGHMTLPRTRTESSGFVEWGDRFTAAYRVPINPGADDGLFFDSGRNTQPRIIVQSDGTVREFRQEDFPDDVVDPNASDDVIFAHYATRGIVDASTTTNTSTATITQNGSWSMLNSNTQTCSSTTVRTATLSAPVTSCVGGGGGTVMW